MLTKVQLHDARDNYRTEYLQKWAETAKSTASKEPIDVLICPVSSVQGTPHDVKPWWGYCSQWNLLDYPSGVIPAGKVLKTDAYPAGYEPVNELDKENMELCRSCRGYPILVAILLTSSRITDDNGLYYDLPVAIQVVAPTHEDEKLMGAMKVIDRVVNG